MKAPAYLLIALGLTIILWFGFEGDFFKLGDFGVDLDKAGKFAPFMGGVLGPIFALTGTLLVFENFRKQQELQISNQFFNLIGLHLKIIEGINTTVFNNDEESTTSCGNKGSIEESKGMGFFDDLARRIVIDFDNIRQGSITPNTKFQIDKATNAAIALDKKKLMLIYGHYFHVHQSDLSHYFTNIYRTIKYIDESGISKKKKQFFIKTYRAILSNYELLIIAYNGLYYYGEKFKLFIDKYELLDNLNFEIGLDREEYDARIISNADILINEYPHLRKTYEFQKRVFEKNN